MAKTTQSNLQAAYATVGGTQRPDSIEAEGRIRFLNDIVETTVDNVATDEITLLPLPKGAKVDRRRSFIYVETAPASTVTCDIGFSGDKDELCDGANIASAGKVDFLAGSGALGADLIEVPAGEDLILTLNTMTTPAAGKFRVSIAYYVR